MRKHFPSTTKRFSLLFFQEINLPGLNLWKNKEVFFGNINAKKPPMLVGGVRSLDRERKKKNKVLNRVSICNNCAMSINFENP